MKLTQCLVYVWLHHCSGSSNTLNSLAALAAYRRQVYLGLDPASMAATGSSSAVQLLTTTADTARPTSAVGPLQAALVGRRTFVLKSRPNGERCCCFLQLQSSFVWRQQLCILPQTSLALFASERVPVCQLQACKAQALVRGTCQATSLGLTCRTQVPVRACQHSQAQVSLWCRPDYSLAAAAHHPGLSPWPQQ